MSDDFKQELDDMKTQLDDLMDSQVQQLENVYKKTLVYSILWPIITAIVYFVWPSEWYVWIPSVISAIVIATFIFVLIMRKKLHKKIGRS